MNSKELKNLADNYKKLSVKLAEASKILAIIEKSAEEPKKTKKKPRKTQKQKKAPSKSGVDVVGAVNELANSIKESNAAVKDALK